MGLGHVFPLELERDILETAAQTHLGDIPRIILVARRVRTWIEPLLYRIVEFDDPKDTLSFLDAIRAKSASVITNVKKIHSLRLSSTQFQTSDDIQLLLETCSGVNNLMLCNQYSYSVLTAPSLPTLLAAMHLRRLTVQLDQLFTPQPIDFDHPLFMQITHLHLLSPVEDTVFELRTLSDLEAMPRLTHLAFDPPRPNAGHGVSIFWTCLRFRSSDQLKLKVVVLTQPNPHIYSYVPVEAALLAKMMELVPYVVILALPHPLVDWKTGAQGGDDIWTRGEALVDLPKEIRGELVPWPR
ncbi:hypothetical protein C8R43DRAFT_964553 [Mycena crocata]|nr:hypothetical protein C8R43DRAFT_964553 [Mycena crocata]